MMVTRRLQLLHRIASFCANKYGVSDFLYQSRVLLTTSAGGVKESGSAAAAAAAATTAAGASVSVGLDGPSHDETTLMPSGGTPEGRQVGKTPGEFRRLRRRLPDQPEDSHTLKVAIIGAPNAGKSTLTNSLAGWKVAAVSKKVHTTRDQVTAVLTEDDSQIIFLDTPGLVHHSLGKRYNLERSLVMAPWATLNEADLIGVLVDMSNSYYRNELHPEILKALRLFPHKPAVLILNKIDLVKDKKQLLNFTRNLSEGIVGGKPVAKSYSRVKKTKENILKQVLEKELSAKTVTEKSNKKYERLTSLEKTHEGKMTTKVPPNEDGSLEQDLNENVAKLFGNKKGSSLDNASWQLFCHLQDRVGRLVEGKQGWAHFDSVFMLSALDGDGVEELKYYLMGNARPGRWRYHSSVVTEQEPMEMARLCVWEKLLDHLNKEVPYQLRVEVAYWQVEEHVIRAIIHIVCPSLRHKFVVLGKNGERIKAIVSEAKQELLNTFRHDMSLKVVVRH